MKNKYEKTKAMRHKEKFYASKDENSSIVFVTRTKPTLEEGVFAHYASSSDRFEYVDDNEKRRLGIPLELPLDKPILYEIEVSTKIKMI